MPASDDERLEAAAEAEDAPTPRSAELHPKRTTSFAARRKKKPPVRACVQ
jgi:hypothetical protein